MSHFFKLLEILTTSQKKTQGKQYPWMKASLVVFTLFFHDLNIPKHLQLIKYDLNVIIWPQPIGIK